MKLSSFPSGILIALLASSAYAYTEDAIHKRAAVDFPSINHVSNSYAQLDQRSVAIEQLKPKQAQVYRKLRTREPWPQKEDKVKPKQSPPPKQAPPPPKQAPPPPKQNPPPPKQNPPPPKQNPPPPKQNPPPPKQNPPPPKQNPPPPKQNPPPHCNGKNRLARRQCLPFWPFSKGAKRNGRDRKEPGKAGDYEKPIPNGHANDRMIQVAENQVGFLVKNSKFAWFTPPNTAIERTSVGAIKAIGAVDVGLCSMVAIANQHGAVVAHMSPTMCKYVTKELKLDANLKKYVDEDFKGLKADAELFFDNFKRDAPGSYDVILAVGSQTDTTRYGEWMADVLFGIKKHQIHKVINLIGNGTPGNSISTFFIDYSTGHGRILHGPSARDGHPAQLKEISLS